MGDTPAFWSHLFSTQPGREAGGICARQGSRLEVGCCQNAGPDQMVSERYWQMSCWVPRNSLCWRRHRHIKHGDAEGATTLVQPHCWRGGDKQCCRDSGVFVSPWHSEDMGQPS